VIGYILGLATAGLLYVYHVRKTSAGPPYGMGGKPWYLR